MLGCRAGHHIRIDYIIGGNELESILCRKNRKSK